MYQSLDEIVLARTIVLESYCPIKVQILWEVTKIWKKSPIPFFWNYLVTLKQSVGFFQIFVAFSEYVNFKNHCPAQNQKSIGQFW